MSFTFTTTTTWKPAACPHCPPLCSYYSQYSTFNIENRDRVCVFSLLIRTVSDRSRTTHHSCQTSVIKLELRKVLPRRSAAGSCSRFLDCFPRLHCFKYSDVILKKQKKNIFQQIIDCAKNEKCNSEIHKQAHYHRLNSISLTEIEIDSLLSKKERYNLLAKNIFQTRVIHLFVHFRLSNFINNIYFFSFM